MSTKWRLVHGLLLAGLLAGCGGGSAPTAPGGTPPPDGGDNGGGGPPSAAVTVTVGNIFFRSDRNGTVNGAVDTVAAGGKVTWKWVNTGAEPHTVASLGAPGFSSSSVLTGTATYEQTFTTPGTYRYNCAVHGNQMTGLVVVLAQ